jgi:polysaccharide chain length determinant protein (PEP-CTERM system associated)
MNEIYTILISYIQQALRYRLPAFLMAVTVCIVGWAVIYRMPNVYEAKTLVYVDTESLLKPLLRGIAVDDSEIENELLRVTQRSLLSKPNLRRVARETDMDLRATTEEQMERLLAGLAQAVEVTAQSTESLRSRRGVENIVEISYRNQDPRLANRVVESLLDVFMESVMGANRKGTDQSERFLQAQIAEYSARLDAAEKALEQFKIKNAGHLPSEGQSYFEMVRDLKGRVEESRLHLREAENRRDKLREQIRHFEEAQASGRTVTPTASETAMKAKVEELESRLADLTLRYTDQHPDVVATRRTLEEARQKLEEESAREPPASGSSLPENAVLDQLRVEYGKAEADVAALKVRADGYETRLGEADAAVGVIPKVEADYTRLTRDYDIYKAQYDELVRRREAAHLSREADLTADASQFRVINPPQVPLIPVSPDRPALLTGVLLGGLAAGAGLAFLLSQIRPTFVSAKDLRNVVDLPVLGKVTNVLSPKEKRKARLQLLMYGAGLAFLLVAYAYVLLTHGLNMDVMEALKDIVKA